MRAESLLLLGLALLGCETLPEEPKQVCERFEQRPCACEGGQLGVRTCDAEGTSLSACQDCLVPCAGIDPLAGPRSGVGAPSVLADLQGAHLLRRQGDTVYWLDRVGPRALAAGGGSVQTIWEGKLPAVDMRVVGDKLFLAGNLLDDVTGSAGTAGVWSVDLAAAAPVPVRLTDGGWRLASDGAWLYFNRLVDPRSIELGGTIERRSLDGTREETVFEAAGYPAGLHVQGGVVYWPDLLDGEVSAYALESGRSSELACEGSGLMQALAFDEGYLYCFAGDELRRIPLGAGAAISLAPGHPASNLVVADGFAYWFEETEERCGLPVPGEARAAESLRSLVRVSTSGGQVEVLLAGQPATSELTVQDRQLHWLASSWEANLGASGESLVTTRLE